MTTLKLAWRRHGEEIKASVESIFEVTFMIVGLTSPIWIMLASGL
tara:strand:- start:2731 stop:2865 length:135 start_codon:yes stop_codon:yes gene_type:complete